MKSKFLFIAAALLWPAVTFSQPRWSPEVRAQRELKWMKDSLLLNESQLGKVSALSLKYQQQMDQAAEARDNKKKQAKLMKNKDASLKGILSKGQYQRYYNRETLIRRHDTATYKGHQPY